VAKVVIIISDKELPIHRCIYFRYYFLIGFSNPIGIRGNTMAEENQKQYYEEQKRIKAEIEKKYGKTAEQLYEEREKRIQDAIALKEQDRIPLSLMVNPSEYTDIQRSTAYYDPIGFKRANRQVAVDFEPDMCFPGLPTSDAARNREVIPLTYLPVPSRRMWSICDTSPLVNSPCVSRKALNLARFSSVSTT
jgi:hypothetical protein